MGTGSRSLNSMVGLRCANPTYQVWVVMAGGFRFPSSFLDSSAVFTVRQDHWETWQGYI